MSDLYFLKVTSDVSEYSSPMAAVTPPIPNLAIQPESKPLEAPLNPPGSNNRTNGTVIGHPQVAVIEQIETGVVSVAIHDSGYEY